MILIFILAITFTIGISAICSILEAMILSTTTAEIEELLKYSQSFVSQGQYQTVSSKLTEIQEAFEKEKGKRPHS